MPRLTIEQFKCFVSASISLNKLSIFAGSNGNGKSTAIQALLYLRNTIEQCCSLNPSSDNYDPLEFKRRNLPLNGPYCLALGSSGVVLNNNSTANTIRIGMQDGDDGIAVSYQADSAGSQLWLSALDMRFNGTMELPLLKHEFYYLNAERLGPRVNQSLQFSTFPNAGWQGENTAQLVGLEGGYFKIDSERMFRDTTTNFLLDQTNSWLGFIMPGVRVTIAPNAKALSSQILIENQYTASEPTIATNLGFGTSYVLPIIVTGLAAKKGSYMIVENPEAHLHPSAQSRIGRFLAKMARAGVNVIIETHSDHIINGLQIAVAQDEVTSDAITINYFAAKEESIQPDVQAISISKKGELADWPSGFFDQTQLDYSELFKLRKK